MKTKPISHSPGTRLDRELDRERAQRVKNDDEKAGGHSEEEFRNKDARDNVSATHLPRSRPR